MPTIGRFTRCVWVCVCAWALHSLLLIEHVFHIHPAEKYRKWKLKTETLIVQMGKNSHNSCFGVFESQHCYGALAWHSFWRSTRLTNWCWCTAVYHQKSSWLTPVLGLAPSTGGGPKGLVAGTHWGCGGVSSAAGTNPKSTSCIRKNISHYIVG